MLEKKADDPVSIKQLLDEEKILLKHQTLLTQLELRRHALLDLSEQMSRQYNDEVVQWIKAMKAEFQLPEVMNHGLEQKNNILQQLKYTLEQLQQAYFILPEQELIFQFLMLRLARLKKGIEKYHKSLGKFFKSKPGKKTFKILNEHYEFLNQSLTISRSDEVLQPIKQELAKIKVEINTREIELAELRRELKDKIFQELSSYATDKFKVDIKTLLYQSLMLAIQNISAVSNIGDAGLQLRRITLQQAWDRAFKSEKIAIIDPIFAEAELQIDHPLLIKWQNYKNQLPSNEPKKEIEIKPMVSTFATNKTIEPIPVTLQLKTEKPAPDSLFTRCCQWLVNFYEKVKQYFFYIVSCFKCCSEKAPLDESIDIILPTIHGGSTATYPFAISVHEVMKKETEEHAHRIANKTSSIPENDLPSRLENR